MLPTLREVAADVAVAARLAAVVLGRPVLGHPVLVLAAVVVLGRQVLVLAAIVVLGQTLPIFIILVLLRQQQFLHQMMKFLTGLFG